MGARSKACVNGSSLAGIAGSNPAWAWKSVSCKLFGLSVGGLCDGPMLRPENSRLCVIECDHAQRVCAYNKCVERSHNKIKKRKKEKEKINKSRRNS
jgi:hypothetical protein